MNKRMTPVMIITFQMLKIAPSNLFGRDKWAVSTNLSARLPSRLTRINTARNVIARDSRYRYSRFMFPC